MPSRHPAPSAGSSGRRRERRLVRRSGRAGTAGQTTVEYALVILGAAAIAGLLIAWAKGGAIGQLFDKVISGLLG